MFKSYGDSVSPCYCVFQSRGLLIQVPEATNLKQNFLWEHSCERAKER